MQNQTKNSKNNKIKLHSCKISKIKPSLRVYKKYKISDFFGFI